MTNSNESCQLIVGAIIKTISFFPVYLTLIYTFSANLINMGLKLSQEIK